MQITLKPIASILIVLIFHSNSFCQSDTAQNKKTSVPRNHLKINVTSLALKNYNFQYERVLSKRISFLIGYRTMPNGPVPFKQTLIDNSNDPAGAQNTFDALRISNVAITPELRLYTGKKGYGRGFYFAPFYRMATFNASGFRIDFTNASGNPAFLDLKGELIGKTYGLMIGAQWSLAKNISLDWQILGAHYGQSNGKLTGNSFIALNQTEQTEILNSLKDIDIPLTEETFTVNASGASMAFSGPWGGLRAGLTLGIKF